MKIIDLNGCTIEVTDLKAAIEQADTYRHYYTDDEGMKLFVLRQQTYWQDIYEKLLGLKARNKR